MIKNEACSAVLDIDAERQVILNVLLHTLADPGVAEDLADTSLLARVSHGLVHGSMFVSWCGYCVRTEEGYFDSRCLAGTMKKRLRIPKDPADPVWRATEEKAVVVWSHGNDPPLTWVAGLGADACEIACFPFGQPGLELVGIIGVRRTRYFERIGLTYFLTFSHVGRLALQLRDQALHDALTNLPNRRLFLERLVQARNGCRRDGRFVGIGILDFDGMNSPTAKPLTRL